jgi:molybdopterin adenylyltransferase
MNSKQMAMNSGKIDHHRKAAELPPAKIAIITVSDSRTPETDTNGIYLKNQVVQNGFVVGAYQIVRDEPAEIDSLLENLMQTEVNLVLFNGGTGISKRDTTFDVISKKLEKVMPGFGELFRMLSYEQVGAAAMFSRAIAGVYKGKVIISTPGSPAAVQLAWEKLILPEIQHLVWELNR